MGNTVYPKWLESLVDVLAEGLPVGERDAFAKEIAEAVKGVNEEELEQMKLQFLLQILVDPERGVYQFFKENGKQVINDIAALHRRVLNGETVAKKEWKAAAKAAEAATVSAASWAVIATAGATGMKAWITQESFKYGVTRTAAEAAACVVGWAAILAARAMYHKTRIAKADDDEAGAASLAVRQAHYKWMAAKLIELLQEAQKTAATKA